MCDVKIDIKETTSLRSHSNGKKHQTKVTDVDSGFTITKLFSTSSHSSSAVNGVASGTAQNTDRPKCSTLCQLGRLLEGGSMACFGFC